MTRLPFVDADADVAHDAIEHDDLQDVTLADDDPDRCCKGGWLQLRCKLCPQSPTYWRLTEADMTERQALGEQRAACARSRLSRLPENGGDDVTSSARASVNEAEASKTFALSAND